MNKNLINSLLGLGVLAVGATSCSTIQNTADTETVQTRMVNLTMAEIEVSPQKATATANWSWNPFNSVSSKEIKENVSAQLLRDKNADVLIEPQYEIKRRGLFRGGSVTVTGYPAVYTGFRPMNETDASVISELNGKRVIVTETQTSNGTPAAKKPYVKKVRKEYRPYKFLNLVGGPISCSEFHGDTGGNIGLMYGRYNSHKWGWFIKANFNWVSYGDGTTHGGSLSVGGLKAFSNVFGIYLGVGFGSTFGYYSDYKRYHEEKYDWYAAVPIEYGVQFRVSEKININAGCSAAISTDSSVDASIYPYVGIGLNF